MKVFLNNKLIDSDKAFVSASDGSFLYGAGLFETMRSYDGVVFRLSDHLARLLTSAKALAMEHEFDEEFLSDAVYKVLEANKLTDARIRLTMSAGSVSPSSDRPCPTLLVAASQLQPYPDEYYEKGVLAVLCPYRQNVNDPTCGHKVTSYFSRMTALRQAHEKHAAEAIWFTTDGRLAEGCVSNVFLIKDGKLLTSKVETPVLPGVARKTVIEIATKNSIEVEGNDITIDDMLGADEMFVTNVIMQVMPVSAIEKHAVGAGKPGEVTKKLHSLFNEFVQKNCEKR